MSEPLLALDNISVQYGGNSVSAVRDLSLSLAAGEILGLVGESGSGKTTVGYAILGHLGAGRVTGGAIRFFGRDLLAFGKAEWARLRGRQIGMVYQEPQSALNPAYTVGEQIAEGLRHHFGLRSAEARARALDWISRVHLPQPPPSTGVSRINFPADSCSEPSSRWLSRSSRSSSSWTSRPRGSTSRRRPAFSSW
jgi:peptide/nickel transport system ATP-binding protein